MSTPTHKELFLHPIILSSIGAVVVIAIGSGVYYVRATQVPVVASVQQATSSTAVITSTGVVEPAQNPDLTFANSGRITRIVTTIGATVHQGQTLASLDTATLSAQRAGAAANAAAAEAQLAQMLAGARQEDIAIKQTALDQANASLTNTYASAATSIVQAYDQAFSGFSQSTNSLFNQANSNNPSLLFSTTDGQVALSAVSGRTATQSELSIWQTETTAVLSSPTNTQVDASIVSSLAHLQVARMYADSVLAALSGAITTSSFTPASVSAAQVSVGAYRDGINALIATLQSTQQKIVLAKLAVQSAQNALSQIQAPATPEQIAAQKAAVAAAEANVANFDAQLRNDTIVAPFTGTISSVHNKVGDLVSANTPVVSLNPESALQITSYFSEIDSTKLHVGDTAQVTLDAYGSGRVFEAKLVSVDSSPSTATGGGTGYKATFQFEKSDPAIVSGMTANITIPLSTTTNLN